MSPLRLLTLFSRDLVRGPRSPVFLYALLMPVIIVLVTRVVLIAVIEPTPRMGVVDLGDSEVTSAFEEAEGVRFTRVDSEEQLRRMVEANDVDAGLVLRPGFDEAVRAGDKPPFEFTMSGESRVTHRLILAVTAWDFVRDVEGEPPPARVRVDVAGDASLPIRDLVVLGVLLWPLLVCSTLVPGFLLVQERETRTLQALLVTPATMAEIMAAKGALGFAMAYFMCLVTLALAGALTAQPVALVVCLAVSILMCVEIGLLYGTIAKDGKAVYNIAQTMNMVILAPLIFYFFPSWPQWPAKLFPTWWFIDPLYEIAMHGASLAAVWAQLAVAMVFIAALAVPVVLMGRRMAAHAGGS